MMHILLVYFQGNLQFNIIIFLLFGLLVKGSKIELNVIIYLPRTVFFCGLRTNVCMCSHQENILNLYFEPSRIESYCSIQDFKSCAFLPSQMDVE